MLPKNSVALQPKSGQYGGTTVWWWAALVLVLAGTRILARQLSPWEWDDFVFAAALDTFAPHQQVPHPPFYPGFVGVGRMARWIVGDSYAALTWVSVAAGMLSLGFLFLAANELLGCRRRAVGAVVLFAFFPAVWLHAGVPLSDPLGLAVALAGWWLVLLARRRPWALTGAAAAAAAAVSVRPQTAVVVALPLLHLVVAQRPRRKALAAVVAGAAGVIVLYALPIVLAGGGLGGPWRVFSYQTNFVVHSDSLMAHHWDLFRVAQRYLVDLWGTPWLALVVAVLVVAGATVMWRENPRAVAALTLAFAPYVVLIVVFCDPQTAGRYAMPALAMVAILAAVALTKAEQRCGLPSGLLLGFVTVACAVVAAPGVMVVSQRASPPVAAAAELRRLAADRPFQVVFEPALLVHVAALFPGAPRFALGSRQPRADVPAFSFSTTPADGASAFSWPHQRFFARVGRGRYLHVAVAPLPPQVVLGAGFHAQEIDRSRAPEEPFHWMGRRGVLVLPPSGSALHLTLDLVVPLPKLDAAPTISVAVGGALLDSFVATASRHSKMFHIARSLLHPERPTEMVITTTHTFVPAARGEGEDRRVLGLQVRNPRLKVLAGAGEAVAGGR